MKYIETATLNVKIVHTNDQNQMIQARESVNILDFFNSDPFSNYDKYWYPQSKDDYIIDD